ncbi:MAG: hypothetical protein HY744_27165 [Deltaproteobacteria bacterium]|nr:hypothetical protein [Deltaproteobacteria bacterium]
MPSLSQCPPRPRDHRPRPCYPRCLGFGLLGLLAACGGTVEVARERQGEPAIETSPHQGGAGSTIVAVPLGPGGGGAGGQSTLGSGGGTGGQATPNGGGGYGYPAGEKGDEWEDAGASGSGEDP